MEPIGLVALAVLFLWALYPFVATLYLCFFRVDDRRTPYQVIKMGEFCLAWSWAVDAALLVVLVIENRRSF